MSTEHTPLLCGLCGKDVWPATIVPAFNGAIHVPVCAQCERHAKEDKRNLLLYVEKVLRNRLLNEPAFGFQDMLRQQFEKGMRRDKHE